MNDESYKRLLDHRRTVKDLILGFIARLRPPGWADSLIVDSLREGPTENVTDYLRRRYCQVLWIENQRAHLQSFCRLSKPLPPSARRLRIHAPPSPGV